jgi:hypothetical protein
MLRKALVVVAAVCSLFVLSCAEKRCEEHCREECSDSGLYYYSSESHHGVCECECRSY